MAPAELSLGVRASNIRRLASERLDVLVVGGGINGAGIARDAAMRGLKVAVVEKGDFASGTSSKSSKLIHGGLRYLEHFHFRLVRDACRERDRLRKLAPHLVRPMAFLFPVYRGDPVGLIMLELGMVTYDLLAAFRNIHPHRFLTRGRVGDLEPALKSQGLKGAALYYDCWTNDARLTLETILGAHQEGAIVANYVEILQFLKSGSRIVGAEIADQITGARYEVSATVVVNAAGPWLDQIRRLDDPGAANVLRLTKGVHIIVPRDRVRNQHAIVARSPADKRILFVIPWEDRTLVGTTDTDFDGSADEVRPEPADIRYLLDTANEYFPTAKLGESDVVSAYAGLRPLVASNGAKDPSEVGREEKIFTSSSGLISLGGGKLTTYRLLAREVVDLVFAATGVRHSRVSTARRALPGGQMRPDEIVSRYRRADRDGELQNGVLEHVVRRYGSRAEILLKLLRDDEEMAEPLVKDRPDLSGEAILARQAEMAVKIDDIIQRRTDIGLLAPAQIEAASNRISSIFSRLAAESHDLD